MTQRNYLQHGDRHRPLGTDPIPGLNPRIGCRLEGGHAAAMTSGVTAFITHTATIYSSNITIHTGSGGADDYVEIVVPGIYLLNAQLNFQGVIAGGNCVGYNIADYAPSYPSLNPIGYDSKDITTNTVTEVSTVIDLAEGDRVTIAGLYTGADLAVTLLNCFQSVQYLSE